MKRFWTDVARSERLGVLLDGRPLRTPARAELILPTAALADAVAAEWRDAGEDVDPRLMALTGLANAAIDRVAADPREFAADLGRYAGADLLCYRAQSPRELAGREAAEWDPLLEWARDRYGVEFVVTAGIRPVAQPDATLERLRDALNGRGAFELAGLSPLVTIGGSLVTALAVAERAIGADQGWRAVSLDEFWQLEKWGEDAEALMALRGRERDWLAAARFLALLG